MVLSRVKKVVGITARAANKTAQKVQQELAHLHKSGVLSKTDVTKLLKLVTHESEGSKQRLMRFAKSELKHDASVARSLGTAIVARAKQAAKVLQQQKKATSKKKRRKK